MNVYIFTWNTQSISYKNSNNNVSFMKYISNKIIENNCDIVIIALQEDSINDSDIIDIFNIELIGRYKLIQTLEMSGWGMTTFKNLKDNWKYTPRGLRLALFKNNSSNVTIGEIKCSELLCPSLKEKIIRGKGGLHIYIKTNLGNISFINIHLPFNSKSIMNPDNLRRYNSMMWQAHCLKKMYFEVLDNFESDIVFICGDLNFRTQIPMGTSSGEIVNNLITNDNYKNELLNNCDELRLLFSYYKLIKREELLLLEGIDDRGPLFLPTCKLQKGRTSTIYKLGKKNQRSPSWCDRILYKCLNNNYNIKCNYYNNIDVLEMNMSDHSGVIGLYSISEK